MPKKLFTDWPRTCAECQVGWHGGPVCWNCLRPTFRPGEEKVWESLTWDERTAIIKAVGVTYCA